MTSYNNEDLRLRINGIFHDIIPESIAIKCQRNLNRIKNKDELNKRRINAKDQVCLLLDQIGEMQNQPTHKIQTVVRKSSPEVQLFLIERVITVDIWMKNNALTIDEDFSIDFADFVRKYLIDAYNDKLPKTS